MHFVRLRVLWCSELCDRRDDRTIYRVGSLYVEVAVYLPQIVLRFCRGYRERRGWIQVSR